MTADHQFSQVLVTDDFTKPSSSYRTQAWLAMLGLLFFVAVYVGLASWFTYTTYRMLAGTFAGGDGASLDSSPHCHPRF